MTLQKDTAVINFVKMPYTNYVLFINTISYACARKLKK